MTDFSHLDAIDLRLWEERARLRIATKANEIALRTVWVAQIEKERTAEVKHLGIESIESETLSDEDLLAELLA